MSKEDVRQDDINFRLHGVMMAVVQQWKQEMLPFSGQGGTEVKMLWDAKVSVLLAVSPFG